MICNTKRSPSPSYSWSNPHDKHTESVFTVYDIFTNMAMEKFLY